MIRVVDLVQLHKVWNRSELSIFLDEILFVLNCINLFLAVFETVGQTRHYLLHALVRPDFQVFQLFPLVHEVVELFLYYDLVAPHLV